MRRALPGLVAALVVMAVVGASAKGPTIRIAIEGPRLGHPIEVTNPDALVNIWTGTRASRSFFDFPKSFVQDISPDPQASLPRYTLTFYVKEGPAYVVRYTPDPQTGGGYVYLPLGDRTIVRPGDGHWNRASAEWSAAINAALAAHN